MAKQSLRRSKTGTSRSTIKRSESAPTLAPVWEPDGDEHDDEQAQALYMHSFTGDSTWSGSSLPQRAAVPRDSALPATWLKLLASLSADDREHDRRELVREMELAEAVRDSLCAGGLPLHLQAGLVEQRYELKRQLTEGRNFKVMEGVHRQTQKNHSLKIVSLGGRGTVCATKAFDTMQAFHMICSFVDEVYCHPSYVCVCMKWGMHEVDSSHQLCKWIVESVRVLLEVLPARQRKSSQYLRLGPTDVQHLLLRSAALDLYLMDNLFIE